jgi:multidrug resistance protein, MATE family
MGETNSEPNEQSSLIPKSAADPDNNSSHGEGEINHLEQEDVSTGRLVVGEFWILFRGSIPVILAYALQNSLQTISVLIVGRASPEDLATAAFSYMFAMCTGWLIALGGSTALDTLASSSFTGSSNKHDLGILLQRSFIMLGLFYIPVCVLWFFSEPLFIALGQDAQLSRDSAKFLTCLIPGGLGYIYFEAMKKYLQAQEIMRPGTYVLLITSPVSAALNYLFCYVAGWGLFGAPFATGIAYWLSFFLLVLYSRFVAGHECWGGWTKQSLHHMGTFARLAVLGIIHVGTEWWAFEIVAIVAGQLGTIPLASQSVIMTADQVMNTIPFGVGVAASARVGNMLGARNAKGAARSANTAAWLSMFLGVLVLAILMGTRNDFAKIFNDDPRVVKLTAEVLPYVALFQIADGLNGSCGGSLRGMGRQHIGATVNIVSYYCGALPLGIYLAKKAGWGLPGLWIGQCIALYLVGIGEWIIVAFSDWDHQVKKAFERMDQDERVESGLAVQ